MGRDDPDLVAHTKIVQCLGSVAHGRPVGLAAHDDTDPWCHAVPPSRPLGAQLSKAQLAVQPFVNRDADTVSYPALSFPLTKSNPRGVSASK